MVPIIIMHCESKEKEMLCVCVCAFNEKLMASFTPDYKSFLPSLARCSSPSLSSPRQAISHLISRSLSPPSVQFNLLGWHGKYAFMSARHSQG